MKKFKYKAEAYLRYVKFEREKFMKNLAEAQGFKAKLEQSYQGLEDEMKQAYFNNEKIGEDFRTIHFVNDNNLFIVNLKEKMAHLSQEIARAEELVQKAYQELENIQIQVKKIELHKEDQEKKYRKELAKKRQKQFDEINSTRQRGRHAKSV